MRRRIAAMLFGLACWAAPTAAHACTFNVSSFVIDDPDEPGLSSRERIRRADRMRDGLEKAGRDQLKLWRREAKAGLGAGSEAHARSLVDSMIADPIVIGSVLCGGRYVVGEEYRNAESKLLAADSNVSKFGMQNFAEDFIERMKGCNEEMVGRLADYVVGRVEPERLAVVWYQLHRLGFDRAGFDWQGSELYSVAPDLTLTLGLDREANGHGASGWSHRLVQEADAKFNRQNWASMRKFLIEDEDARVLAEALQQGLRDLGDPAHPYRGLCPATTAGLDEFVAAEAEKVRPKRPVVEFISDAAPSETD